VDGWNRWISIRNNSLPPGFELKFGSVNQTLIYTGDHIRFNLKYGARKIEVNYRPDVQI